MSRADEFDAFYAHTRRRLLHQIYAMTGDRPAATEAVSGAFASAWRRWGTLPPGGEEAWVRQEAQRLSGSRSAGPPPLRPGHADTGADTGADSGADPGLLAALRALSGEQRRLVVLQTLAGLDLASAAREVGLSPAAARQATDAAMARLSPDPAQRPSAGAGDLRTRLDGLRAATLPVVLPAAATIRSRGGRRRRRLLTAAAVIVVAGVVTPAAMVVSSPPGASREAGQPGRDETPTEPPPPGADEGQLLAAPQLSPLDPRARWRIGTGSRPLDAVCQPRVSADPRSRDTFVRTFRADTDRRQVAFQVVEVSRSRAGAARAYRQRLGWYAGCQVPRLQLVSEHTVSRRGGDVRVLSLRRWLDPARSLTVAVARSGVVSTALVHEVDQAAGPTPRTMTRRMSAALDMLCTTSNGACGRTGRMARTLPPTGEGPGFLGVVDLPPVGDLGTAWVGTEPARTRTEDPAATLCDEAGFADSALRRVRSRSFVMPEADLPGFFGLSQTVGRAPGPRLAARLVEAAAARVAGCPDREPSAKVGGHETVRAGDVEGHVWRLSIEIADDAALVYRLGLVRVGDRVSELSFNGTAEAGVGPRAFSDLVLRAGERLRELDARR